MITGKIRKVLYLGGFELPDLNAAAQRVIAIAKTIRLIGCDVEFIGVTNHDREVGRERQFEGFRYTSVKYPQSIKEWLYHITKFLPLETLDKNKPDVVILYNFPAYSQKRIIKYCKKRKIKVIADITEWYLTEGYTLRDIIKRFDTKQRMCNYNFRVDGIIAISRYLYDYYRTKVPTVYVPATVDLSEEKWNRNIHSGIVTKPIKLVYAGSPGSGFKDKLDTIVRSISGRDDFILNIVGITKGQYDNTFTYNATYTNITFCGRVSHENALKIISNSDFDVIIREDNLATKAGFPTKFVEAYSCGVPVIATPSSNIKDYLKNGENGFLIDENQSFDQVLDKISKMSDNELLLIKKNAMSIYDFDYHNYINEIEKILGNK